MEVGTHVLPGPHSRHFLSMEAWTFPVRPGGWKSSEPSVQAEHRTLDWGETSLVPELAEALGRGFLW